MLYQFAVGLALASTSVGAFSPVQLIPKHQQRQGVDSLLHATKEAFNERWAAEMGSAGRRTSTLPVDSTNLSDLVGRAGADMDDDSEEDDDFRSSSDKTETESKRKIRANVRETGSNSIRSYMKSVCNHDLLNKNEEIILGREIQILIKWEATREVLEQQLLR